MTTTLWYLKRFAERSKWQCNNYLALMMRDWANRRKYRTETQVAFCRGVANEEYGRWLKECDHNKK